MTWTNPRNIQRLSPPKGIDPCFGASSETRGGFTESQLDALKGLFHFEYMGSADYEWGQIPQAIHKISENSGDYEIGVYSEYGRKLIHFFVAKSVRDDLFQWIRNHLLRGDSPSDYSSRMDPKDPTRMAVATDTVKPEPSVETIGWLALGTCPWFATTDHEVLKQFVALMRGSFATVNT